MHSSERTTLDMNAAVTYGATLRVPPLDGHPAVRRGTAVYQQEYGYAAPVKAAPIGVLPPVDSGTPLPTHATLGDSRTGAFKGGFGSRRLGPPVTVDWVSSAGISVGSAMNLARPVPAEKVTLKKLAPHRTGRCETM